MRKQMGYNDTARVPHDPYSAFRFTILIDGGDRGGFNEASGLVLETEVQTLRAGGINDYEIQLPGPLKFQRLVLKRGLGDITYLWDWYRQVSGGEIVRKNIDIKINNNLGEDKDERTGKPMPAWHFKEACPVKWTGPELRANTSAIAFESLELVHRGLAE
jgi:phage tail-like protein